MSPDLLELTQNYFIGNTVRQVSTACNEDERSIGRALRSALPLALGVLLARTQQPGGVADLFARVYRVNRLNPLSNFGSLLSEVNTAAGPTPALDGSLPGPGPGLLRTVLGPDYDTTVAAIGQQAGVAPDTVRKLLGLAVPVGLGLLGRHAVQHTLDARGLASYLATQQAPIVSALQHLPAGVGQGLAHLAGEAAVGAVSLAPPASRPPVAPPLPATPPPAPAPISPLPRPVAVPIVVAPAPAAPPTPAPRPAPVSTPPPAPVAPPQPAPQPAAPTPFMPPQPAPQPVVLPAPAPAPVRMPAAPRLAAAPRRWPWLLALLLVVVLAIAAAQLYLLRDTAKPTLVLVATPADSAAVAAAPTDRPHAADGNSFTYLAGRATLRLVGGTKLRVSNNSAEARLYQFLQNPMQTVSLDNTEGWILLDQVFFAPGTTTLTPGSGVQLANLAGILQTYRHASIKLGGYTNDQPNAEKNLPLSADCANAARRQLLRYRLGPNRVAAEGYGQAPTRTAPPASRTQSRRVYVRVTKKY